MEEARAPSQIGEGIGVTEYREPLRAGWDFGRLGGVGAVVKGRGGLLVGRKLRAIPLIDYPSRSIPIPSLARPCERRGRAHFHPTLASDLSACVRAGPEGFSDVAPRCFEQASLNSSVVSDFTSAWASVSRIGADAPSSSGPPPRPAPPLPPARLLQGK